MPRLLIVAALVLAWPELTLSARLRRQVKGSGSEAQTKKWGDDPVTDFPEDDPPEDYQLLMTNEEAAKQAEAEAENRTKDAAKAEERRKACDGPPRKDMLDGKDLNFDDDEQKKLLLKLAAEFQVDVSAELGKENKTMSATSDERAPGGKLKIVFKRDAKGHSGKRRTKLQCSERQTRFDRYLLSLAGEETSHCSEICRSRDQKFDGGGFEVVGDVTIFTCGCSNKEVIVSCEEMPFKRCCFGACPALECPALAAGFRCPVAKGCTTISDDAKLRDAKAKQSPQQAAQEGADPLATSNSMNLNLPALLQEGTKQKVNTHNPCDTMKGKLEAELEEEQKLGDQEPEKVERPADDFECRVPGWEDWLASVNIYRCMHDVPAMHWDDSLAMGVFNDYKLSDNMGRLVDAQTRKAPDGPGADALFAGSTDVFEATKFWYKNIEDCGGFPGCRENSTRNVDDFTAMMWQGGQTMGCFQNDYGLIGCRFKGGNKLGCRTPNYGDDDIYDVNIWPLKRSFAECVKVIKVCGYTAPKGSKHVDELVGFGPKGSNHFVMPQVPLSNIFKAEPQVDTVIPGMPTTTKKAKKKRRTTTTTPKPLKIKKGDVEAGEAAPLEGDVIVRAEDTKAWGDQAVDSRP